MIQAILFDFGGVITTSPFDAFENYEREISLPLGAIRQINSTNPDSNAWAKFERNEVSKQEFMAAFEDEARSLGYTLRADRVLQCLETTIRPKMIHAIERLRLDYKIAILTNNLQENVEGSEKNMQSPTAHLSQVIDLVDEVIESSKVGVRKPEKAFYEKACKTIDVDPRGCVFLDDLGINLKPAREMGMKTIKVINEMQALIDLYEILG